MRVLVCCGIKYLKYFGEQIIVLYICVENVTLTTLTNLIKLTNLCCVLCEM